MDLQAHYRESASSLPTKIPSSRPIAKEKLETIDSYRLSVRQAIQLMWVGTDIERFARGQATTKAELYPSRC